MSPESLHPQIARFAADATDEMSTDLVGHIIGIHAGTVVKLCQARPPKIEVSAITARGGENRFKYTFTKAGVLAFIIRSTAGPRDAVLHAIEVLCPGWLPFAQKIAKGLPTALAAEPPASPKAPRSRLLADPYANHPDFFR